MKWFHHECAASNDPKLQILGSTHGAEGLGIFWGILERIGQHSDTFHLKVMQISEESDQAFMNLLQTSENARDNFSAAHLDLARVPRLPAKILAKNLFTSLGRLKEVIETCVQIGLFDSHKWMKFNVLYSFSFEQSADDYTRRRQKNTDSVRTDSEHCPDTLRTLSEVCPENVGQTPDSLRTKSANVLLETEAEEIQKKNRRRTEEDLFVKDAKERNLISTSCQHDFVIDDNHLIELSQEAFLEYGGKVRSELSSWNDGRSNKFDWNPTEPELRKLFLGGDQVHKETLCYSAYNLLGEKTHYAELVLRAVRLMLKASEKARITNPFGWMWTCLHGNGDGTHPWVQLLTADEENSVASLLRRRVRDNHPP
jgi:hypothetical protein